jgi:hypothetical protein
VARGVTTHGFAVNVENDLQPFGWIVPCGLEGVRMTSLIKETHRQRDDSGAAQVGEDGCRAGREREWQMTCFRRRAAFRLAEALDRRQRLVSLARIESAAGALQVQ